uniref:Phosphatidylinositol-specific phospholipase C X domain-containing protein n=1 Tax=Periophthalmus magnuspinnatus TaxID=409849 RepID=A0A3B4AQ73_9GOBI
LEFDSCGLWYGSNEPGSNEPELTKLGIFNDKKHLDSSSFNLKWMSSVPDDVLLSGITIPGTHESLSRFGGVLAVCQVWTLEEQLKAGVRYLDIYVGIWQPGQKTAQVRDSHWKFKQHMTLDEVFEIVLKYLQDYPSEMVLMKIKIRGLLKDTVLGIIKKTIEKFQSKIWEDLSMPNLGQVRGKIVLVRSNMLHLGVDRKKSYLLENGELENIDRTLEQIESTLCQSYIVVTEKSMSYLDNAKKWALKVNEKIDTVVKMQQVKKRCLGVVSVDFPGPTLIGDIINVGHSEISPKSIPYVQYC